MPCVHFEVFDGLTEEQIAQVSSFLSAHGAALSTELTGWNKEQWLAYHKENFPEVALDKFLDGFAVSTEECLELIGKTIDIEHMVWDERQAVLKELVSIEVAKNRLSWGF